MKELVLENRQTSHLCIGLLKHLPVYTVHHQILTKLLVAVKKPKPPCHLLHALKPVCYLRNGSV